MPGLDAGAVGPLAAHAGAGAPVRLLHRDRAERSGGLSGALAAGYAAARGAFIVCLDGDLQHSPDLGGRRLGMTVDQRPIMPMPSREVKLHDAVPRPSIEHLL